MRFLALLVVAGCLPDLPAGTDTPDAAPAADARIPPPDAPDVKAFLREWSGCMTVANFHAANMATAWGTLSASNNQECSNCHGLGGQGFIASQDEPAYFKVVSEHSGYMLKYFSVDFTGTPKVVINTGSMRNAGVTLATHPRFDPVNNAGMIALRNFYDSTLALKVAGTCGASVLAD